MTGARVTLTARKVYCPTCAAPRFEYCVGPDGEPTERSHPARVAAARLAPDLTPAMVAALRAVHLDPARVLHPTVRLTLLRRQPPLIVSIDPPRGPTGSRLRRPAKQRHVLTEAGLAAIGEVGQQAGAAS